MPVHYNRIIQVSWNEKFIGSYFIDVQIRAHRQEDLIKEITILLANAKIDLISLNSVVNKEQNTFVIKLTLQLHDLTQLNPLMHQLTQLRYVIEVRRIKE